MAKREGSVVSATISEETNTLEVSVAGVGTMRLNMAAMSAANQAYGLLHGMKQRIIDAGAQSRDPATGLPASPQDKFNAMKRLVDHYASGAEDWNLRTATGERGPSGEMKLLGAAIAEIRGKPLEEIMAWLKGKSASERQALSIHPSVEPVLTRMKAEATAGVDEETLFEGLE